MILCVEKRQTHVKNTNSVVQKKKLKKKSLKKLLGSAMTVTKYVDREKMIPDEC